MVVTLATALAVVVSVAASGVGASEDVLAVGANRRRQACPAQHVEPYSLYKEKEMNSELNNGRNAVAGPVSILALAVAGMLSAGSALAARLNGQVLGGGAPVANSTITLWAASAGAPKRLAQ